MGRYSKAPKPPEMLKSNTLSNRPIARRIHKAQRRLEPETIVLLVADYEAGAPSTELMVRYNIGKGTVLNLLREHGVKVRGQGLPVGNLSQAVELYKAGWSLQQLGERFSCDAETVRKRLIDAGVRRRSCHERVR